jgi:uncharacterized membrane protein YadS
MKHERSFHEDWLLIAVGALALAIASFAVRHEPDPGNPTTKPKVVNRAKGWFPKLEAWGQDPTKAFYAKSKSGETSFLGRAVAATWLVAGLLLLPIALFKRVPLGPFFIGYTIVFTLGVLAFVMASQETVKYYNLEYVLWALLLGLLISNTVGVPVWLKPMLMGDSIIKVALVIFGAEVLFGKLVALGPPGIYTSWLVTPIVLVTTFWFGQRILKISSPSLNMVISADMSVCGVSAAIATGAACRAKKEEVSYAIGVSLLFTAIMMVLQPQIVLWSGMDKWVGAAWMGGTIDSTGAVAAAGAILGDEAATVANTVKMIQNVLIGVIAFAVAAYWASRSGSDGASEFHAVPRAPCRHDHQGNHFSISHMVVLSGLCRLWAGNRFPSVMAGPARRKTARAVFDRSSLEHDPLTGHGLSHVRRLVWRQSQRNYGQINVKATRRNQRNLLILSTLLVSIWLIVLPWIGRLPGVSDHIDHMKRERIHPDAMFYTELEQGSH